MTTERQPTRVGAQLRPSALRAASVRGRAPRCRLRGHLARDRRARAGRRSGACSTGDERATAVRVARQPSGRAATVRRAARRLATRVGAILTRAACTHRSRADPPRTARAYSELVMWTFQAMNTQIAVAAPTLADDAEREFA